MEPQYLAVIRIIIFILVSIWFVTISWSALKNPDCHGFYRFFVFEGTLILVLMNYPFWFDDPFSAQQLVSWFLLFFSAFFVLKGFYQLKKSGGSGRASRPEELPFESTVHLVREGLYRYVRHPMYSSLLLLAWGAFMKRFSLCGLVTVLPTTAFVLATARIEERENRAIFGPRYEKYRKKTRMFIPWLF